MTGAVPPYGIMSPKGKFYFKCVTVIVMEITVVVFCVPKTVQSLTFKIVILAVYCRFSGRNWHTIG